MSKLKDLIGQRFGKLTVIEREPPQKGDRYVRWKCQCDCGREVTVNGNSLKNGMTQSCGCIKVKDISGQRFGLLTVIRLADPLKSRTDWLCKCDCGDEIVVNAPSLRSGKTKSCGCILMTDYAGKRFGRLTAVRRYRYKWLCKCDCGGEIECSASELLFDGVTACDKCRQYDELPKNMRFRICKECRCEFLGGPRAWYCPECRKERKRTQHNKPAERKIGSTDICENCGQEYAVNSGLQKYCPDCQPEMHRQLDAEQSLMLYHRNKSSTNPIRNAKRRNIGKKCKFCGKAFYAPTVTLYCSDECRKEMQRSNARYIYDKRRRWKKGRIKEVEN